MADETVTYEATPLNAAIGGGTIYRTLGIVVGVGLLVSLIVGFAGVQSPGTLSDGSAFLMGGLVIIVLSIATLVLLFSLTGTIRYINREMQDLTRLRKAIETSYARLADSAQALGQEIGELRTTLPNLRKIAVELQKVNKKTGKSVQVVETTTETESATSA